MTFDMRNYKALALRTEAPVSDKALKQAVRGYELIKEILEEARDNAPLIDKLKRYCIYGKDDPGLVEQLTPIYPTGERAERVRQCIRLLHGLMGVIGECGEMAEPIMSYIEGETPDLDLDNIRDESGDALWFLNLIAAFCGYDLVVIAAGNVRKLHVRYKDKFTLDEYEIRDRDAENLARNMEAPGIAYD